MVESVPFHLPVGADRGAGWYDRRRRNPFRGAQRWDLPWRFYRMEDFNNGTVGGVLPGARTALSRGPREFREAYNDGRGLWSG